MSTGNNSTPEAEDQGPIKSEGLTPQQKQMWGDTMSLMAWTCPGFRHIFYKLLSNNDGQYAAVPTRRVPIAATDGKNILINPDTFFGYSLKERVFIVVHEVIHNVYDDVGFLHRCRQAGAVPMHDGSTLPLVEDTMQRAMDYRINALISESRIGECPKGGLLDPQIAGPNDSIIDTYKKLYEDGDDGQDGQFDVVLQPGASTGQNPQQAQQQRNPQQWAIEVAAAQTLEQMRSQGKLPAGLSRMFNEILNPKIPWTEHIQSIFNRRVGSGSYNWRRPDRRFLMHDVHLPSKSGHAAGWIVVWGDTSGSIGNHELDKYLGELAGVLEDVRPRRLTILWCDAAIHRIDEVEEVIDLHNIKSDPNGVGGGGGTSVHPVMEWIDENTEQPEVFIGFTDGCVTFPDVAPAYPVIWASVSKDVQYPFGDVVHVE